MPDTHIGSILILLKRDTGSVAEPDITGVTDYTSLEAAYPDAFCRTPESSLNISADELEILDQANDGTVYVAEKRKVKPVSLVSADVKDIKDALLELMLGENNTLSPGKTYYFWAFMGIVNPENKLTFATPTSNVEVSAKRIVKCYVSVTLLGDMPHDGQNASNATVEFVMDPSKSNWHGPVLDVVTGAAPA